MLILVINCGSSSAKYQLFDVRKRRSLSKGIIERIGQPGSRLTHHGDAGVVERRVRCPNHWVAIRLIANMLVDKRHGAIRSKGDIAGIGHRVVHGGEEFKRSTLITAKVIRSIERVSELAPLHNPPALLGIKACAKTFEGIPQVAVFDTSFHQTMPLKAFLYAIPLNYYRKYGVRRYGFHGTSHRFVAEEAAVRLKRPLKSLKLITCHLGNGCSMAAVKAGRSVDTTMGLTPLEGLIMGTRSGDLDPAIVLYLLEKERISTKRMNDILNKESGFLGLSGVSNDMRDIVRGAKGKGKTAKSCRLALEMFIYRIEKYIGAYQAAMGGADAVIFTAGIGEKNPWLIRRIRDDLKAVVSRKTRFLVIPTNEELMIAKDTDRVIKGN